MSENPSSRTGTVLVILQFAASTVIALHAGPALRWWPSAIFVGLSGLMMVASVVAMGKRSLRIHPQPADSGQLRTGGIYRFLRHPMYSALLLASLVILWTHPAWPVPISVIVVAIVLRAKIVIEERELRRKFPAYSDYAQKVPALIPFFPRNNRRFSRSIIWITILAPSLWLPFESLWDARLFSTSKGDGAHAVCVNLSASEAKSLLDQRPDIAVIDVRSEWEARHTRLSGALQSGNSKQQLEAATRRVDRDTPVLIYCAGGFRSRLGINSLKQLGFREIYHLDRGIMAWKLANFPTESATERSSSKESTSP